MSNEAMKLAKKWQQTDWNTESPMSADFAVSEANDVISALMDALRKALEEQPTQQEPLTDKDFELNWMNYQKGFSDGVLAGIKQMEQALTQPAQRTWVGLTDDERAKKQ